MSEPAISVTGLGKRYGHRTVLRDLDLDVAAGETLALLGPNGAGKTTTVEILEGHRTRDHGDVRVLGTDPGHAGPDWRSRVGIVLQDARDLGDLPVGRVVRHFARYYTAPRDPDELIDAVGLRAAVRTPIGKLSGGQRRRLDVALGIIGRPELLFLDEPTTGFDPEARHRFWDLVRALRTEGTTILLTTHYLDEAEQLSDRVAVIANGVLVANGPPHTLGGRERDQAVVRWLDPDGTPRQVSTGTPGRVVAELLARADGAEPTGLTVSRPSLEDIYLRMIASTGEGDAA
jgi:ABC-2 type transport system ATP-binding protein